MLKRLRLRRALKAGVKLLRSGPSDWWLLLRAQRHILSARARLRARPPGALVRDIESSNTDVAPARSADRPRVEASALAVDRMARWGYGPSACLVRSMALHRLLEARDIPGSRVRVGVRMQHGRFEAHAWVEWNSEVVGDDPRHVASFEPFSELVPSGADLPWAPPATSS